MTLRSTVSALSLAILAVFTIAPSPAHAATRSPARAQVRAAVAHAVKAAAIHPIAHVRTARHVSSRVRARSASKAATAAPHIRPPVETSQTGFIPKMIFPADASGPLFIAIINGVPGNVRDLKAFGV